MKKQNKENLRRTLLQIMRPYAKFIVKIQDGIYLKTRFGVQKLRDDKSGLYLKNANKKKLYLHRWNKTSSFGANMPPPPPPDEHPEPRRLFGEVNRERVSILQDADAIYMDILIETGEYNNIWQAFAVLIPVKTVGVMGDQRTYENLISLRAVTSLDGMTADWYRMPAEVLSKISNKIVNNVKGVNRVVYDVTSKPPSTIELE